MKRPLRIILSALIILAVLLGAATCVLWVRSYRITDGLYMSTTEYCLWGKSLHGAILVYYGRGSFQGVPLRYEAEDLADWKVEELVDFPPFARKINWNLAGSHFWFGTWGGGDNYAVIVRRWQVMVLCLTPLAGWVAVRSLRRK